VIKLDRRVSSKQMMSPRAGRAYSVGSDISDAGTLPMETKIVNMLMSAMTAGMTAITLLFVMHHDLGLPRDAIRVDALLCAAMTGVLAIALSCRR
jgi:hypothetical protein